MSAIELYCLAAVMVGTGCDCLLSTFEPARAGADISERSFEREGRCAALRSNDLPLVGTPFSELGAGFGTAAVGCLAGSGSLLSVFTTTLTSEGFVTGSSAAAFELAQPMAPAHAWGRCAAIEAGRAAQDPQRSQQRSKFAVSIFTRRVR